MSQKISDDPSIKNIIFDLGGVLLDLSVESTLTSFSKLSGLPKAEIKQLFETSHEFAQYERGALSDAEFRDFIRSIYRVDASDEDIDGCWVAMLKDLPAKKLELLLELKKQYRTFLLSNTNNLHLAYFNTISLAPFKQSSFDDYFHQAYYSHLMGKRKPDAEIYEQVLDENKLDPEQTIFLDDNVSNLEGAGKLGIKTIHIPTPDFLFTLF
jgi:putative hydrolase of the HAD superfamily